MADLPTTQLGRSGLEATRLSYGALELQGKPHGRPVSDEQAATMLNTVLDAGINLIDTSPDYGASEEHIGAAIAHRRDEYFLARQVQVRDRTGLSSVQGLPRTGKTMWPRPKRWGCAASGTTGQSRGSLRTLWLSRTKPSRASASCSARYHSTALIRVW